MRSLLGDAIARLNLRYRPESSILLLTAAEVVKILRKE